MFDYKLGRCVESSRISLILVISPLISLMVDQVINLRTKKVDAAIITSLHSGVPSDLVASESDLKKWSLLFCAPEAVMGCRWRETLETSAICDRVVAVAIDEVHCVSKWYVS